MDDAVASFELAGNTKEGRGFDENRIALEDPRPYHEIHEPVSSSRVMKVTPEAVPGLSTDHESRITNAFSVLYLRHRLGMGRPWAQRASGNTPKGAH